jgi:homoserine O-acetyltransferase
VLARGRVAFETFGRADRPAVAVLGGISAGRHLAASDLDPSEGWWESFVGPDRAVDTDRFRAIGIDFLGGHGASSGVDDLDAGGAGPARPIGTRDQARALAKVLDYLGVPRLHALVGSSYGGMVALAFATEYPTRVGNLVCISAAHRPHPMATALRSLQRKVVRLGLASGEPERGLSVARGLAMTTYRTAREFEVRFGTRPVSGTDPVAFPVESYLDNRGDRFAARFSTQTFLGLSESLDLHDVDPGRVRAATTLVAVESDTLVPPWQVEELAGGLAGSVDLVRFDSLFGHDAFLKEVELVSRSVSQVLSTAGVAS